MRGTVLFVVLLGLSGCWGKEVVKLDSFKSVKSCVPFNILVRPSDGDYRVIVDADKSVLKALDARVKNKALSLGLGNGFSTKNPIRIIVELPAGKLKKVESFGGATLVVGPGFKMDYLKVFNLGTGKILVSGLTAEKVEIADNGVGDVVVRGDVKKGSVRADGVAQVYLLGATESVDVVARGGSQVYVQGGNQKTLNVKAKTSGLGSVRVGNVKSCSVDSDFSFFSGRTCRTFFTSQLPSVTDQWTCGMKADGSAGCADFSGGAQASVSGRGASASAATGAGGSFATASAGGTSFSSGRASASIGTGVAQSNSVFLSDVQVSSGGQNAVAFASLTCQVEADLTIKV